MWGSAENLSVRSTSFREDRDDDEEALRWAALERLPTYTRVRRGIFRNIVGESWEVNVDNLQHDERKVVLDRLFKSVDDNWDNLFNRIRLRFDRSIIFSRESKKFVFYVTLFHSFFHFICRVDLEFPKIEVRFQHLAVEAYVQLGSRALPTISNFVFNMTEVFISVYLINYGNTCTFNI